MQLNDNQIRMIKRYYRARKSASTAAIMIIVLTVLNVIGTMIVFVVDYRIDNYDLTLPSTVYGGLLEILVLLILIGVIGPFIGMHRRAWLEIANTTAMSRAGHMEATSAGRAPYRRMVHETSRHAASLFRSGAERPDDPWNIAARSEAEALRCLRGREAARDGKRFGASAADTRTGDRTRNQNPTAPASAAERTGRRRSRIETVAQAYGVQLPSRLAVALPIVLITLVLQLGAWVSVWNDYADTVAPLYNSWQMDKEYEDLISVVEDAEDEEDGAYASEETVAQASAAIDALVTGLEAQGYHVDAEDPAESPQSWGYYINAFVGEMYVSSYIMIGTDENGQVDLLYYEYETNEGLTAEENVTAAQETFDMMYASVLAIDAIPEEYKAAPVIAEDEIDYYLEHYEDAYNVLGASGRDWNVHTEDAE